MAKLTKTVPPLPQTERGQSVFVSTDKPGERIIYSHSSDVLWRPIAGILEGATKPEDIFVWRNHTQRVTCVSMSPNCQWMVSGDVNGAIKVWGAKGDNCQKHEFKLWNGAVKEAIFSGDNTRILAAGDGAEVRAVALIADTGSKTGDVTGHAKQISSISFKNTRPFRIVTGGEDNTVIFHQGPPFKYLIQHQQHTNFVNCVRYSPDGNWVVSAGSDSAVFLYEGKDGEMQGEFEKPAGISGSLWAVEWSPDSTKVVTAGGDKIMRVWDRDGRKQLCEAKVGAAALEDMQIGVCWATDTRIISVCLDGRFLVWDVAADGALTLAAVQDGSQGPLMALAHDAASGALIRGGVDGHVVVEQTDGKVRKAKVGKMIGYVLGHSGNYTGAPEAWVFSKDEKACVLSLADYTLGQAICLNEMPQGVAWFDEQESKVLVVTTKNSVLCVTPEGVQWRKENLCERSPTAMGYSTFRFLAVGMEKPQGLISGVEQNNFDIAIFDIAGPSADGIVPSKTLKHHYKRVTSISFSSDGDFMASADASGGLFLWKTASWEVITTLGGHTSAINSLNWLPGTHKFVSAALDTHLIVWDADEPKKKILLQEAHKGGATNAVACGDKGFASVGQDGFMKVHTLD